MLNDADNLVEVRDFDSDGQNDLRIDFGPGKTLTVTARPS
jgi:hypothetical protein